MTRCKVTIEVPFLLFYGTCIMVGNLIINLMTYKVCYNILHYPEANCSRLGQYTDNETQELERLVQPHAGVMTAVTEMVPATVPVIMTLFVGSWSDKYGRKPVLLFVLSCMTIAFGSNAILLLYSEINPWFLMLTTIPIMCCGGVTTFLTITLAYLNDMSTPHTRAMRMVTFDIVQILATLFGGLCSSYVLYATSYAAVYGIGCAIIAFCTVYTYLFVPESLDMQIEERPTLSSVFSCRNVMDLFKIALKRRLYNRRAIILLIISCVVILGFIATGEVNVKTQFLRNKLGWTLTKRNVFGAWSSMVVIASTLLTTYLLHTRLKVKEILLIFLALLSAIGSSVLYTVADSDASIYVSVAAGVFSGMANPMLRTMLTKLIVPGEMGKVFSLIMVVNNFCLLGAALTYQEIYNDTMKTKPETFNYVSIGLNSIVAVIVIIVTILEFRIPSEKQKIEENLGTISTEKLTD
ncbi:unnamed protein product [Phyllotreta striolata]|uniref:Proton-coupled folate transporter n=1 Tax=Phyllotreta striolata TaxID=444603 RepID=A0A9N9TNF3_PHYSR|nr:unnamed protein product [Phyllotreta striolata]